MIAQMRMICISDNNGLELQVQPSTQQGTGHVDAKCRHYQVEVEA